MQWSNSWSRLHRSFINPLIPCISNDSDSVSAISRRYSVNPLIKRQFQRPFPSPHGISFRWIFSSSKACPSLSRNLEIRPPIRDGETSMRTPLAAEGVFWGCSYIRGFTVSHILVAVAFRPTSKYPNGSLDCRGTRRLRKKF